MNRLDKVGALVLEERRNKRIKHMSKYHDNTEIVCPHCDCEFSESYEYIDMLNLEDIEVECEACSEEFILDVEVTVTYSTEFKSSWCRRKREVK